MNIRFACVLAALFAAALGGFPVRAQDAGNLKKDMVGQWELATTERSKTCVLTLKGDATAPGVAQGMKLELEPGCAAALPFTRDITAWSVRGLDIVRMVSRQWGVTQEGMSVTVWADIARVREP